MPSSNTNDNSGWTIVRSKKKSRGNKAQPVTTPPQLIDYTHKATTFNGVLHTHTHTTDTGVKLYLKTARYYRICNVDPPPIVKAMESKPAESKPAKATPAEATPAEATPAVKQTSSVHTANESAGWTVVRNKKKSAKPKAQPAEDITSETSESNPAKGSHCSTCGWSMCSSCGWCEGKARAFIAESEERYARRRAQSLEKRNTEREVDAGSQERVGRIVKQNGGVDVEAWMALTQEDGWSEGA